MKSSTQLNIAVALAIATCLTQVPIQANTAAPAPRMTGQELVDDFRGRSGGATGPMNPQRVFIHQRARGYLDGVSDGTEGSVWCYKGRLKAIELNHELIGQLAQLSPSVLKGNAGPLVLNFLREKYPCPSSPNAKRGS